MTKKIVNESLKSPSLTGDIASFHKDLISKTAKRAVLVILSGLFLLLQYVGILFPTQSANSADINSDTIYGGFSSKQDLLLEYEAKKSPLRDSANALSISRSDLAKTVDQNLSAWVPTASSLVIAWSRSPVYSLNSEDRTNPNSQHFVALSNNGAFRYFGHIVDAKYIIKSNLKIVSGYSTNAGKFAILKNSGNFLTTNYNADTCYKDPSQRLSYTYCPSSNSFHVKPLVTNVGYKTDAHFIKSHPGDHLHYELLIENRNQHEISLKPELFIGDILEYSELSDVDLARFDKRSQTLQWPEVRLASNEKKIYSFDIQIVKSIPISSRGSTNGSSYDCYMTSFFGEISNIKVSCPTPKTIERILSAQPENSLLALSWSAFIINILLWLRAYVLSKEYEIIIKKVRTKNV